VRLSTLEFLIWTLLLTSSCGAGPAALLQAKLEDYQDKALRLEVDATLDVAADLARSRRDHYLRAGYNDLQALGDALDETGLSNLADSRGTDAAAPLRLFLDLDQVTRMDGASAAGFARLFSERSSRAADSMTSSFGVLSSCVGCREARDLAPTLARLALVFGGDRELAESFRQTAGGLARLLNSERAVDILEEIPAGRLR